MSDYKKVSWVVWLLLAVIFAYYGINSSNYFAVGAAIMFFALLLSTFADSTKNS
jgi:hypothetical protein